MKQFEGKVKDEVLGDIEKGYEQGFVYLPQLISVNPTALEVVEQYQYARSRGWLTKNDEANFNNRWLQFTGKFLGAFETTRKVMTNLYGVKNAHIYANWIKHGHQYGRHNDDMDVIILQMWNSVSYCVESVHGEKKHTSYTLQPGDAIYIRAGTWHTPIIYGERATMSFSWR